MGSRAEPTQSWGGSWGWELLSTACWGCRGSSSPGIQGPLRQSPHGAPNTTMHCTRLKAKGNRAFSFLFFSPFGPCSAFKLAVPIQRWKVFCCYQQATSAPRPHAPLSCSGYENPSAPLGAACLTHSTAPCNSATHPCQHSYAYTATEEKKAQCFFSCSPPRTKPIRRDTREAWMWLTAPHGTHSPIPAPRCWRGHAALRKSGLRLTYINTNHKKPKHSERETLSARKHRKIKAVAAPQRKHSHPSVSELQQGSPAPLLKAENAFFHPPRTEPRKAGGGPGPSRAASPGLTPAAAGMAARPRAAPSAGRSADAAGC